MGAASVSCHHHLMAVRTPRTAVAHRVSAAVDAPAALIIASVPLWVVLYGRVAGERIAGGTLAGVALGFAGVAILLLPGGSEGHIKAIGLVLVVLAAPCWALGSFLSARRPLPSNPFLSTALQMMIGGLISVVAGVARGELGSVHPGGFSADSL